MFHVGGARSVLFNWAIALRSGGTLVLRIEDTDAARNRPEWIDGIISALSWLGIDDSQYEGPFYQSDNLDKHSAAGQRLYAQGRAYYCDCTRADVIARTGDEHRGYDGYCRDRGLGPGEGRALRFRAPDEGATVIDDLVRGETVFENSTIEDFVLARADGSILFLLANVVDDMEQRITHVIRSEEHLPNAPKQQLLWEALGHEPPAWGHLPIVVNEKRQKLSKRRDKVALEDFREEGYLATAMRNYLMLLGWAPRGDREIVPWDEMVAEFRLEDVNPSPAFFDVKKLRAFNGDYIRALSVDEFIAASQPWLQPTWHRGRPSGLTPRCSPSWRHWRRPGWHCSRTSRRWWTSRSYPSLFVTRRHGRRPCKSPPRMCWPQWPPPTPMRPGRSRRCASGWKRWGPRTDCRSARPRRRSGSRSRPHRRAAAI